jgi:hypothetical protein
MRLKVPARRYVFGKSGIGLPHSKTLARISAGHFVREVVECGSPMPLSLTSLRNDRQFWSRSLFPLRLPAALVGLALNIMNGSRLTRCATVFTLGILFVFAGRRSRAHRQMES